MESSQRSRRHTVSLGSKELMFSLTDGESSRSPSLERTGFPWKGSRGSLNSRDTPPPSSPLVENPGTGSYQGKSLSGGEGTDSDTGVGNGSLVPGGGPDLSKNPTELPGLGNEGQQNGGFQLSANDDDIAVTN